MLQEEQPSNTSAATDDAQLQSDVSTESEALPYAELTNAGINAQIGLDYCCGEVDFYREMLQMFYFQSNEKKEEIISLYEAADWADYAVKVHALKSTSLTIGAEDLSSQAKALEQAGKKGDSEYIQTNHMSMLRAYEEVCDSISQLIDL